MIISYICIKHKEMKNEFLNAKFKDVSTADLINRVNDLESQLPVIQNLYNYMYKEWYNEIAYRLYVTK